jgi:hypothetical protein
LTAADLSIECLDSPGRLLAVDIEELNLISIENLSEIDGLVGFLSQLPWLLSELAISVTTCYRGAVPQPGEPWDCRDRLPYRFELIVSVNRVHLFASISLAHLIKKKELRR